MLNRLKRRVELSKEATRLSKLNMYGFELYDYLEQYTGDEHPFVKRPLCMFWNDKLKVMVIGNQETGAVTLLWK